MTPTIQDIIRVIETQNLDLDTMLDWQDLTILELRDHIRDHGDNPWYVDYYQRHENPFYIDVITRAMERIEVSR